MQKVIAKIHLGNVRRNAEKFKAQAGELCAVVKANAYGHGAEEVVNALSGVANSFAVALLDEAATIKLAACGKEILVFTPPLHSDEVRYAAWLGCSVTVDGLATAKLVAQTAKTSEKRVNVHLKTNTGMNRYGMGISELGKVCKFLQDEPFVRVNGIYSHLYTCTKEQSFLQRELFLKAAAVAKRYFPTARAHLSATYGSLLGKAFAFDGVRVGLGLYGYLPTVKESGIELPSLEKGLTVYAAAVGHRRYAFGGAGYGSYDGRKGDEISLLRCGYADGFLRKRENGMQGFDRNLNRLCMDVCLRKGALQKGSLIPVMTDATKTAETTGTVAYEVLCAATRRAELIYDNE